MTTSTHPATQPPQTIGAWSESQLADYVISLIHGLHKRTLVKRFWTATVVNVNYVSNPLQVQVVMDGETNSSGAWFNVAGFTYYPLKGDIVVGVWYAPQQGWVLFPKVEQGRLTSVVARDASLTLGTGWSLIGLDTTIVDGMGIVYSGAYGGFTIVIPGNYRFGGRVQADFASAGAQVCSGIYKNGSLVRQGGLVTNGSGGLYVASMVSAVVACAAGDLVQLAGYASTSVSLSVGNTDCYFDAEWCT